MERDQQPVVQLLYLPSGQGRRISPFCFGWRNRRGSEALTRLSGCPGMRKISWSHHSANCPGSHVVVGRLPVIAPLDALGVDDLARILQAPKDSLIAQFRKLVRFHGADLVFTGALVRLNITEVRGIEFSTAPPVAVHKRDRSDCQTQAAFTPLVELRAVQPAGADGPCALDWGWVGLAGPKRPRPARCGCGDHESQG